MKKTAVALIVLVVAALAVGCGSLKGHTESTVTPITADELREMLADGTVTLVDVRSEQEYAAAHIDGAILIPLDTIGDEQPVLLPDTGATIAVYCRTGVRSAQAASALAALGYTDVRDLGGIETDWPYETVSGE